MFLSLKEMYDWLGSQQSVPLHFSLHRPFCREAVGHSAFVSMNETLAVIERVLCISMYIHAISTDVNCVVLFSELTVYLW